MQVNTHQRNTPSNNLFTDIAKKLADEKISEYFRLYGKHDGAEHDLDFISQVVGQNLSYANRFTPEVFARCRKVQALFVNMSDSCIPLSGHRVKIIGDSYMKCDMGILDDVYRDWSDGAASVCSAGSAHLCSFNITPGFGVPLDVSGGPHHAIDRSKLKPLDTVQANYWFWGERPQASGGIYLSVDVIRWIYHAG